MKKLLRLISVLAAAVLMLTMVSASAPTYEVMDDAIYISSASVPEDATAYALSMFSQLNASVLTSLGFTEYEAGNLVVSQGICANIMDNDSEEIEIYYFPILCDGEILAMITLSWYNNQYNFQFGKDPVAEALNDIETSESNPARIYVSSNAYYCLTDSGVTVLDTMAAANESVVADEVITLSQKSDSSDLANASESVVTISSDSALRVDAYVNDTTIELTGVFRDVTIVPNSTVTDSSGSHGICWASASAAIIDYYLNGVATAEAVNIRGIILQYRLDEYGSYVGYTSTIKSYIELFSGVTMKTISSMLSLNQVKTAILTNNAPCCTIWDKSSGESGDHAMVLCGYYYPTNDPSDSSNYWIRVMDPNKNYYVAMPYSSSVIYTIGSYDYYWAKSVIKS